MSKISLVLTVLGQDRPGLVESIAKLVAEHGANWLESRMAHMAGHFAGILRVEVEEGQSAALTAALAKLGETGLETVVHQDPSRPTSPDLPVVHLDLVGQDRPGIIREISHVLATQGVNVEELHTERGSAPNSGQPVFRATAQLRLAPQGSEESLRAALEAVAADLIVDITLH